MLTKASNNGIINKFSERGTKVASKENEKRKANLDNDIDIETQKRQSINFEYIVLGNKSDYELNTRV